MKLFQEERNRFKVASMFHFFKPEKYSKLTQIWCHLRWSTARDGLRAGRERVCRSCQAFSSRRRFFLAELCPFVTARGGSFCSCCRVSRSEEKQVVLISKWFESQRCKQSSNKVAKVIETHSTVDFGQANCNNEAQNVFHLAGFVCGFFTRGSSKKLNRRRRWTESDWSSEISGLL